MRPKVGEYYYYTDNLYGDCDCILRIERRVYEKALGSFYYYYKIVWGYMYLPWRMGEGSYVYSNLKPCPKLKRLLLVEEKCEED